MILSFMMVLTLTSLVATYLYVVSAATKSAGFGEIANQAMWLAEAGMQKAIWNLMTPVASGGQGTNWTTTGTTESLGEGSYTMVVTRSGDTRTITSTGTIGSITRQLQMQVTVTPNWPDAFDYAIFGDTNNDELDLKDDVVVSGHLYYDGDVEVDEDASVINGLVYADDVSGDGTYTEASGPPSPVPTYPSFTVTTYDGAITTASSTATSDLTLSTGQTLNLTGTVYYKKITIKNDATITGAGTLVATDVIVIKGTANVGPYITILGKDTITVQDSAVVQSNGILYSQKDITVKSTASVTGTLLAPKSGKKVSVKDSATVTGAVYATKVEIKGSTTVTGSVVADEYQGDKLSESAHVTYNSGSIPTNLPIGMPEGGTSGITQVADSWVEQ